MNGARSLLVTGAGGFVGAATVRAALAHHVPMSALRNASDTAMLRATSRVNTGVSMKDNRLRSFGSPSKNP